MAYDPGRSPGWLSDRRTKAAAVVSGVVLAAVASEVDTPQALALPSEAYAAQLEQAAERNPIIEKMNKKLIALWAELQRLKKEHKKGIYRREYKAKGQTYIALSASERAKNLIITLLCLPSWERNCLNPVFFTLARRKLSLCRVSNTKGWRS